MTREPIIHADNLPTLAVVTFILALLSLSLAFYNSKRTNQVVVGVAQVQQAANQARIKAEARGQQRITTLEQRVAILEAQIKSRPAPSKLLESSSQESEDQAEGSSSEHNGHQGQP